MINPTGAGSLGISDDGAFQIHFDRTLRHPISKVWRAITDAETRAVWLAGTRIDKEIGGTVVYDFGEEGAATGEVVTRRAPSDNDPSAQLVHTWQWEGVPTSIVTWQLDALDDGSTRLQLTHAELVREPATDFAIGWHVILDSAARHLDNRALDDVWDQYEQLAAYYSAA